MKNVIRLIGIILIFGLVAFGLQTSTWAATTFDLSGVNFSDQISALMS